MVELISFDDAITDSNQYSKRHLLLGNGFSIECCPDIFHYGSLFSAADFSNTPNLENVFNSLNTQDFEVAIRDLEASAKITPIYLPDAQHEADEMISDANTAKDILLSTIAGNHPDYPGSISDNKFWSCRQFLNHFLGPDNSGQIYTVNYDLLLYWTLMHDDNPFGDEIDLNSSDGFGNSEDNPDGDYVVWHGETNSNSARVNFLHGALHLFDAGNELQKYTWVRTQDRLIDQARNAICNDKFPLFVAEGTSKAKMSKIRHNAYLYQGLKQLTKNAQQLNCCFFIHGHSLADNDDHILNRLGKGRFKKLYISLFGDPESSNNQNIINKAESLAALRNFRSPLELNFYNSQSANIWGGESN